MFNHNYENSFNVRFTSIQIAPSYLSVIDFLHTVAWLKVFSSNTNDLFTVVSRNYLCLQLYSYKQFFLSHDG